MGSEKTKFAPVSLFTIEPDEVLPFRIAIYFKGRHVIYKNPGQMLDIETFNRFVYKRISKVFISLPDLSLYKGFLEKQATNDVVIYEDEPDEAKPQASESRTIVMPKIIKEISDLTQSLFTAEDGEALSEGVKNTVEISGKVVGDVVGKPYLKVFEGLAKRPSTVINHSMRVSLLSTYLGYQLGFVNSVALEYLAAAALMHDIGKTRVKLRDFLDVPEEGVDSKINAQNEIEAMKLHPVLSCDMVASTGFAPEEVIRIIREHHECADGSGYPEGLRSSKIYGLSKVLTMANVFDNLISPDPSHGREAYTPAKALELMGTELKGMFDKALLPKAIRLIANTTNTRLNINL